MTNEELHRAAHIATQELRDHHHFPAELTAAVDGVVREFACQKMQEAYDKALQELSELARYEAVSGIDREPFCVRSTDGEYIDRADALAAVRALKDSLVQEPVSIS